MDASFIVLISFSIFAYFFYKHLWPSILQMLDEHISGVQKQFEILQTEECEQENLEEINQRKLNNLQEEFELLGQESLKKIEFLKQKLNEDMEYQYSHKQKSFNLALKRIKNQQRKALQSRCIDAIFEKIMQNVEKNSSIADKYMVSVTQQVKDDSDSKS